MKGEILITNDLKASTKSEYVTTMFIKISNFHVKIITLHVLREMQLETSFGKAFIGNFFT